MSETLVKVAPVRNQKACLAGLSPSAFALLEPHLTDVMIETGTVLWEDGEPVKHAQFPLSGLVSVQIPVGEGSIIEVGSIAREGLASGCFDDGVDATTTGIVQIGGKFSRIATPQLFALAARN